MSDPGRRAVAGATEKFCIKCKKGYDEK